MSLAIVVLRDLHAGTNMFKMADAQQNGTHSKIKGRSAHQKGDSCNVTTDLDFSGRTHVYDAVPRRGGSHPHRFSASQHRV